MLIFSINFDDKDHIYQYLMSVIQKELKQFINDHFKNEQYRNNNILNLIIYDKKVNRQFGENDKKLLFQRYNVLNNIW